MNKKRLILTIALLIALFAFGRAYPWGSTGGDGSEYSAVQETGVFFNNHGASLAAGEIVVIDRRATETGSGSTLQIALTAGTTLGAAVIPTATEDATGVVGVVKYTCENQGACVIVTKGPIDTLVLDAADEFHSGDQISTGTTAGYGGHFDGTCNDAATSGCTLGQVLEDGDGTDTGHAYIYVNPD